MKLLLKKPNRTGHQAGFTLIEMIVSISIMAVLMTLVVVNFGATNQSRNLTAGRDTLVSELFLAQSNAISSKDVVAGQQPASAYGIVFNANNYQLVAVNNQTPQVQTVLGTYNYPTNVSMQGISLLRYDGTTLSATNVTAYFAVPYGRVYFNYKVGANTVVGELNDTITITLITANGQSTKNVIVNGVVGNITAP